MRSRRIGLAFATLFLVVLAARHPLASIHVDLLGIDVMGLDSTAPPRIRAALDVGTIGLHVLWTAGGNQLVPAT